MMSRLSVFFLLLSVLSLLPARAETYVVVVGVANYQHVRGLALTENDAKTMASLYKSHTRNVITMTGRYATRANILKAMNDQFTRAKKGDMVVFFFSGHGYEGGFCPYDMGRKYRNALSYEDVYSVFRRSKASRKVVIADACMSGGLRKEKPSGASARKSSDVLMFLSSRTNDRGMRGAADANKDKVVTAKELFTYVSKGVKQLSGNRQHPVMWGNFSDDFVVMDWR